MAAGVSIEPDDWLAAQFERPVYRMAFVGATRRGVNHHLVRGALAHEVGNGPAFVYAKVATEEPASLAALTQAGFRVVDVNLTLERAPDAGLAPAEPPGVEIRPAQAADKGAVLKVAASSFVYSRFHLDPAVPSRLANAVKRGWVANYFSRKRGEELLVALLNRRPVGFLAVLRQGETRIIDLIGVGKSAQGRGVGRALVNFFVKNSAGRCRLLRVGTQAANLPSLRLYESAGFRLASSQYIAHAHFPLQAD